MVKIGGKGMSYIVKNCPAILKMTKICDAYETTRDLPQFCKDCTDCVIKQVIEECKWETNIDVNDRGDLAERILSSFDIEEINK
jgi:hypothetical protein